MKKHLNKGLKSLQGMSMRTMVAVVGIIGVGIVLVSIAGSTQNNVQARVIDANAERFTTVTQVAIHSGEAPRSILAEIVYDDQNNCDLYNVRGELKTLLWSGTFAEGTCVSEGNLSKSTQRTLQRQTRESELQQLEAILPNSAQEQQRVSDCDATIAPSIVVTSPVGSQNYVIGDVVNITWTSCHVRSVVISLFIEGQTFLLTGDDVIFTSGTTGSYQWIVPDPVLLGLQPANEYRGNIIVHQGTLPNTVYDTSDIVTIYGTRNSCIPGVTDPWIQVVSPNGGEVYQVGWPMNIEWRSCNITGNVHILLNNPTHAHFHYLSDSISGTPDDGFETFTVPQYSGMNFGEFFEINVTHSQANDQSDNFFSIYDQLYDHDIILEKGWNMISSYVDPLYPDMEDIFGDIAAEVRIVKDEDGNAYRPGSGGFNNIGTWEVLEGYKVKMRNRATLRLSGPKVDPQTPIPLDQGWNIIAYLHETPMDAVTALQTAAGDIITVKDIAGNSYIPAFGINTIGDFIPGQGYRVKADTATTLVYPSAPHHILLTGGEDEGVWSSIDSISWDSVTQSAPWLGAQAGNGLTQHTSEYFDNKYWVIGGASAGNLGYNASFDSVYSSVNGQTWQLESSLPSQRFNHASVVYDGKMWVTGGWCNPGVSCLRNDVLSSRDGKTWNVVGTLPEGRAGHEMVVLNGKMWVLGGVVDSNNPVPGSSIENNDVMWSDDGITWEKLAPAGSIWSPRTDHAVEVLNNRMWLLGGATFSTQLGGAVAYADAWTSADGINWFQAIVPSAWSARHGHDTTVEGRTMYLIGGGDKTNPANPLEFNDIWSSTNGLNWTQEASSSTWSPRTGHAVVSK